MDRAGGPDDQPGALISLIASASRVSRPLIVPMSWVIRSTMTRFHTFDHSGWWSSFSAWTAMRAMKPKASAKSVKVQLAVEPAVADVLPARTAAPVAQASGSAKGSAIAGVGGGVRPSSRQPSSAPR